MLLVSRLLLLPLTIIAGACAAIAQNPVVAFPKNYSIALDNGTVTVIRAHYGPHEHVGVHDHSAFPTIYVYLTDSGPVHFTHDENPPFELNRPPVSKGAYRVSPGRKERHSVDNLSDTTSDYLRIELKGLSVGSKSGFREFRGKAPTPPLVNGHTTEFQSATFDIERIICDPGKLYTIPSSNSPSLLVAFTSVNLSDPRADQHLNDGDIKWLEARHAVSILGTGTSATHLLRIIFKSPQKKPTS
jgi:hypothetical protein